MKLCILHDQSWGEYAPSAYFGAHQWELVTIVKNTAVATIRSISQRDFDVVVNFCDGSFEQENPGLEVIRALERFNLPYTGADASFYEQPREVVKRVCEAVGVKSPYGTVVRSIAELERAIAGYSFPLIVTPPHRYGNLSLTEAARVETQNKLALEAQRALQSFGAALIEEFIEGREFTVLVGENPRDATSPTVYTPLEILSRPEDSIRSYNHKYSAMTTARELCADLTLGELLRQTSRTAFVGLDGAGYARFDYRLNAAGELFLLNVNANGAICDQSEPLGSADFILANENDGHKRFVEDLLQSALARHRRRQRKWQTNYWPPLGHGMVARTAISAGEIIDRREGGAHTLLLREHALTGLDERARERFFRYSYPLTEEIWVVPGRQVDEWRPLNHSCDPSAWLDGLDLIARRDLLPGDPITIDYATLFTEDMPAFSCQCGAAACRGTIRGDDYLAPFVAHYGAHVSSHVRARRAAQARD